MFVKDDLLKEIKNYLRHLEIEIENSGILGFHDDKKKCENFFAGLFNIIYGLNLINTNLFTHTYPAIDLGDTITGVCYQITCQKGKISDKIKKTKQGYANNGLDKIFPELRIFIFVKKPQRPKDDPCVFYKDCLINKIASLDILELEKILDYLKKNFKISVEAKIALEMQTIASVIKHLSSQPVIQSIGNISIAPMPVEKLKLRFQKYSDNIKEEYGDLRSSYEQVLSKAKESCIDDGNSTKIKNYLRRKSRDLLSDTNNDAKEALNKLVLDLMQEIDIDTCETAIRFYLLSEFIECDLFPLSQSEINTIGGNNVLI